MKCCKLFAGLLISFTLLFAAQLSFAQLTLTGAGKIVSVAPSASVWGDHGTNVTLTQTTIANDTANGTVNSFSSVRGTQAHTTGKWYYELKVLTAPAAPVFYIGAMDDTTANGAAMDGAPNTIPNSATNTIFNGNNDGAGSWSGVGVGSGWTLADGDVMGYAYDSDGVYAFGYLFLKNVCFLSCDPSSGASGTGAVMTVAGTPVRPAISIFNVTVGGVFQLITTSGAFTYTPPAGYSAWN